MAPLVSTRMPSPSLASTISDARTETLPVPLLFATMPSDFPSTAPPALMVMLPLPAPLAHIAAPLSALADAAVAVPRVSTRIAPPPALDA